MSPADIERENKALVARWFEEVWNRGRADLIDELRAPDAVAIGLGEGNEESRGEAPFKIFYSNLRQTLPDLHVQIHDILAEGDKVAVRITAEGTHTGSVLGPPPSGRRVRFGGILIVRLSGGKIAEAWNSLDQLGLLKQLGAIPAEGLREDFLITRP
ncbi:MAG TPA: ester cyclase [Bryobacteraceae bacterium]|nr:ester cyclase [Bryobacteraceae bacterium]